MQASELRAAKRFLCFQFETALGAAVHATPFYEALRRAIPDASITVAGTRVPYEVLKYNPHIDEFVLIPQPQLEWKRALGCFLTTVRRKRRQFDCVVMDSGNRRSRFMLLALVSGVRRRLGFSMPRDWNHASLQYDSTKSILDNNLRLVGLLGHPYNPTEPGVFFSQTELEHAESFRREHEISAQRPIVAIQTQTSGGEPNQWYDDRFVLVADHLYQSCGAQLIFVGTLREQARIDSIRNRMRAPSVSAAGRTDLPGLAALLAGCDLLVTLDTGTMHVGRSVGMPMVVIAPAKNPEHHWLPPRSERVRLLMRRDITCRECGKLFCATRECMDQITAPEVMAAAEQHLTAFPCSAGARLERIAQRLGRSAAIDLH